MGFSQLGLDLGLDGGTRVEGASLCDSPCNDGSPFSSHFLGSVACCLVDFCTSKFAAFGKSIVVGPESESLGDVCTSSCNSIPSCSIASGCSAAASGVQDPAVA